jgi:hypothetical protein
MKTEGAFMNDKSMFNRMDFNTATFLLMTGFTTYMQQRGQKVKYGSWMLGNYFSLIPLNLLAIAMYAPPQIYQIVSTSPVAISTAWQCYIVIANVCGFGLLTPAMTFSGSDVDSATRGVLGAVSAIYFGSMLFLLFGVYALFHKTLASSKTLRGFFQQSCLPALVFAVLLVACSFLLGQLNISGTPGSAIAAGQLQLLPMLLLGVCVAELRFQLSASMQAFMGHWLVCDSLFAVFLAVTFLPYTYAISSPEMVFATGFTDSVSVILLSLQMVVFCMLLMALSCQVWHKKRSIIVHFVLRRSVLIDVFGKYSYAFYLFALPVCWVYYPHWVTMLLPAGSSFDWNTSGWLQRFIMLLISLALAMVAQWWQDEYVTSVYVIVRGYITDGHLREIWNSEQNPLCWHESGCGETSFAADADDTLANLEAQNP